MPWNVIWQVDPDDTSSCIERDWFTEILSLVPFQSVQVDYDAKPLLKVSLPYSIICASCPNQTVVSDLILYLKNLPKPRVLYHISDEYAQVGSDLYEHCEFAIRNGSANFGMIGDPNFVQIPLGYVSGFKNSSGTFEVSSRRRCSFAFLGTIKHERQSEMLPALRDIPGPNFVRVTSSYSASTKLFINRTVAIYKNSVFVPNPKGNWNPECNRLYDALEWGCIPLIRRYQDSDYHENYYDKLLGNHPIPSFDDWTTAAAFARNLLSDKGALDAVQAEICTWWQLYKLKLQTGVAEKLANLADCADGEQELVLHPIDPL
jgi:hypothetical protein